MSVVISKLNIFKVTQGQVLGRDRDTFSVTMLPQRDDVPPPHLHPHTRTHLQTHLELYPVAAIRGHLAH